MTLQALAPYIAAAIGIIVYLAIKLHGEAMRYVAEVQFFLNQKTIAFNRTKASLSVAQSKMAQIEKHNVQLERENVRLRKSLEIMNQFVEERKTTSELPNKDFIEDVKDQKLELLERELESIQNVLNGDLKTQLKNYSREVEWLTKRLSEVQNELSKTHKKAPVSYKEAA